MIKKLLTKIELKKIEKFARKNYIPVVRLKTLKVLLKSLPKTATNILEVGTSIGYSGSNLLLKNKKAKLTTLEKDENIILQAKQNFKKFNLDDRVEIIEGDALISIENLQKQNKKFDFIFLDGPKGQYIQYLPILLELLSVGGILFVDDIYYHGLVLDETYNEHKHRTIVNKLKKFIFEILNNKNLQTNLYNIEDGFAICKKVSNN